MAVTVEIAGIVRTTKVGKDISWTDTVNSLKQARFIVADDADGFVPASGQAVEIKQDGTIRFDGQITGRPRRLAGPAHPSQLTFYNVTVGGYELLLNKKTVTRAYDDVAFETIVADLVSTYLGSDGITENVTAGTNHTITFNNVSVAAAIEELCALEADGRTWRMDVGKILTIETLTATAAPVVLDPDLGTLGLDPKPTVEPDMSTYANTVIVTGGGPDLQITQKVLDAAEITARIAVEGGGDGIYEHPEERPDLKTEGEVLAAAQGVLAKRKIVRDRFTGPTRVAGFAAGQSVTVNISAMDISSQVFFIESVRTVTDPAGTEFRHTINGITGDPDGGWQSYYRNEKKQPRTIAMQIEATPGLSRITSRAGALVHAPPTIPALWFQGDASGAVTAEFGGFAMTNDGRNMLIVGRGGAANTGGCAGGQFPGCTPACFDNRQTVFGVFPINATTRKPDQTPGTCGSWDELLASDNFKTMLAVRDDSRFVAAIQYAAPGKFILIDVQVAEIRGSVDTNIDANAFGGEPIWVGDFVFWPEPSSGDIYVYDVSDVDNPTEHAVFGTSLAGVKAIIASDDGSVLWAVGTNGFVGLDNSTAGTLVEDTFLTAGIAGNYNSLALKQSDESIIVSMIRLDASNVRVLTLDVTGSAITKNTEKTVALATSLMDGYGVMFWDDSAICFSARNPAGANSLEAHVFDLTDPANPTFVESFTYTHGAANNRGPFKTDATHEALFLFGGLADAQVTYGVDQYDRVVPYSIDEQLRADFGGTGVGGPLNRYVPGDLLMAISPTELVQVPVGTEWQVLRGNPAKTMRAEWDHELSRGYHFGAFKEAFSAVVTSDGATVTMSLEKAGGGDLTMIFSDGLTNLDCTPALTIALTAGSDTNPTFNYVYILESDKILTVSTADWPTVQHNKVGVFFVPSAGKVQSDGVFINQNINDFLYGGTENMGHGLHIAEAIRHMGAQWSSGIVGNGTTGYLTITTVGAAPDTVHFKSTAGVIYQLHQHTFDAVDTSGAGRLLVVNDSVAAYDEITDLADLLLDSTGASMVGKYFNFFFWGVANKTGEFAPMMVNLPSGSYNKQSDAEQDVSGFDNLSIPAEFDRESTTGFPIVRVTLRHQAASGGTWTHVSAVDLRRGLTGAAGGGTGLVTNEFPDNNFRIFDESDVTKEIAFEASGITTGNTRTLTVPDGDGTLLLATGLAGGQTWIGGTAAGEDATWQSTAHATKGSLFFGAAQNSAYDEVNDRLGIGKTNPTVPLDVVGIINCSDNFEAVGGRVVSGAAGGIGILSLKDGAAAIKAQIRGLGQSYVNLSGGNFGIADSVGPGTGSAVLTMPDGTAPASLASNTAGFYADDVSGTTEAFAIDEAGNAAQLTPHNFELFDPDDIDPYPWAEYHKNRYLGVEIGVNMALLVRMVQQASGEQLFFKRDLPAEDRLDWVDDQEFNMRRGMAEFDAWDLLVEEFEVRHAAWEVSGEGDEPIAPDPPRVPVLKLPPAWLKKRLKAKGFLNIAKATALQQELEEWTTTRGL